MLDRIEMVKRNMDESLSELCALSWMFSKQPNKDFSREQKLFLPKVVSFMLAMEGGTLTNELLDYFGCTTNTASASAFVQQRGKILPEAFSTLFSFFVQKTQPFRFYKSYRLFAADGSDIQIPNNPSHSSSHYSSTNGQSPYNLLHLDALYDLLQCTYQDAKLGGDRESNEIGALCAMVDRSETKKALVIADRNYKSYNLMAHIQEKGWKFLIRVKDVGTPSCMTCGFLLPKAEEFDVFLNLSLITKQTKEAKELCKNKNMFHFVPATSPFDYLPRKNRKHDPLKFYKLPFRIVRFKITKDTYETAVTNLDADVFPPAELKKLYALRWGIETSFRELKYTIGLLHFHAKRWSTYTRRSLPYSHVQLYRTDYLARNLS